MKTYDTWQTAFETFHQQNKWKVNPQTVENLLINLSGDLYQRAHQSFRTFRTFYKNDQWLVSPDRVQGFIPKFLDEITQ